MPTGMDDLSVGSSDISGQSEVGGEPASWVSGAAGPFVTIGEVAIWGLGNDGFRLEWPGGQHVLEGYEAAAAMAREIAGLHVAEGVPDRR
jgi:hypothetical protein